MYYDNYLNSLTPDTSYIPESASINDAVIFADRKMQDIYNEAFFALASQEMTIFEAVMLEDGEASSSDTAKEKKKLMEIVGGAFKKLWQTVSGFFTDQWEKLKKKFDEAHAKRAGKLTKDFVDKLNKMDPNKTFKGIFDFDAVKKYFGGKSTEGNLKALGQFANGAFDHCGEADFSQNYNLDKIYEKLGYSSAEQFKAPKFEKKDYTVDQIKRNTETLFNLTYRISDYKATINSGFKECKKLINDGLKTAKQGINRKDKTLAEHNKCCKAVISFCKQASSVVMKYSGILLSARLNVRLNYNSLITKVVFAGTKKADNTANDTKKDESVEDGYIMSPFERELALYEQEAETSSSSSAADTNEDMSDEEIEETAFYRAMMAYFS